MAVTKRKPGEKRLSKSKRAHNRRVKQAAHKSVAASG
jgi:hypothetical protein